MWCVRKKRKNERKKEREIKNKNGTAEQRGKGVSENKHTIAQLIRIIRLIQLIIPAIKLSIRHVLRDPARFLKQLARLPYPFAVVVRVQTFRDIGLIQREVLARVAFTGSVDDCRTGKNFGVEGGADGAAVVDQVGEMFFDVPFLPDFVGDEFGAGVYVHEVGGGGHFGWWVLL